MGRVVGRFYTAEGNRTAELDRVEAAAAEYGGRQPSDRPPGSPCNVQWSASGGEILFDPGLYTTLVHP